MMDKLKKTVIQYAILFYDTCSIIFPNTPYLLFPELFITLLIVYSLYLVPGLPKIQGFSYPAYVCIGLSIAGAGYTSWRSMIFLMDDLKKTKILEEVLLAPVPVLLLVLVWIMVTSIVGILTGLLTILLSKSITYLNPSIKIILPFFLITCFLSSLALIAWLFLSKQKIKLLTIFILPLILILSGVFYPYESTKGIGEIILWLDPIFQGKACLSHLLLKTPNSTGALISIGILFPVTIGVWAFLIDLARKGTLFSSFLTKE